MVETGHGTASLHRFATFPCSADVGGWTQAKIDGSDLDRQQTATVFICYACTEHNPGGMQDCATRVMTDDLAAKAISFPREDAENKYFQFSVEKSQIYIII